MKIINLVQTCYACPSQWEGKLEDDTCFYVRFRHGDFSVSTGSTVKDAIRGIEVYSKAISDDYGDGIMSESHMLTVLEKSLGWTL